MANYKFVNADQLDADLAQVGDAIRAKGGATEKLAFPDEMVAAIGAISTGVELNFDVVAYATEAELLAATPKENTIGCITSVDINGYALAATEPVEPVTGMVWITTGTRSTVEFNALKKNAIQVYPLSAYQYVGGAWVDVTAMSYQGGEWHQWGTGMVVLDAAELTTATAAAIIRLKYPTYQSVTKEGDYIKLTNTSEVIVPCYINVPYDITDNTELIVKGYSTLATSKFGVSQNMNAANEPTYDAQKTFGTSLEEMSLPIDALAGGYYIAFSLDGGQTIYLKTVKLK